MNQDIFVRISDYYSTYNPYDFGDYDNNDEINDVKESEREGERKSV